MNIREGELLAQSCPANKGGFSLPQPCCVTSGQSVYLSEPGFTNMKDTYEGSHKTDGNFPSKPPLSPINHMLWFRYLHSHQ